MVYAIAIFSITDRAAYVRYQSQFMAVLNRYKGRVLVADEKPKVLEGEFNDDKVVVLAFANEADFRTFADSAEYQEISTDRRAGTEGFVLLTQGVS